MAWDKQKSRAYCSPEYRKNRQLVLKRDLGLCVRCCHLNGQMVPTNVVDHYRNIASGPEPDHRTSNLWLLCVSCHATKTAQEAHQRFNPDLPFGPERDQDGWDMKIDWQKVINQRERQGFDIIEFLSK